MLWKCDLEPYKWSLKGNVVFGDRILSPNGNRVIWVHFKFIPWAALLPYSTTVWGWRLWLCDLPFFLSPFPVSLFWPVVLKRSPEPESQHHLLEMQILWPHPRSPGLDALEVSSPLEPSNMCYTMPFRWFWHMLMLKSHCPPFLFLHMFSLHLLFILNLLFQVKHI